MVEANRLEEVLEALGELLQDRGLHFEVVAIGGGSLLLLGLIKRPTRDLDIVALVAAGKYVSAEPLPPQLLDAAAEIARLFELPEGWLNSQPAPQLAAGLPAGFQQRAVRRDFGGLTIHIASRTDQIAFKRYATVDGGRKSKHLVDLRALDPSDDELLDAARWVKTQDNGAEFSVFVDQVVELVRGERGD
ncbi:MAG TPA: hypothetical protein VIV40_07925 [Kofleriaceae bacterium]